jgi:class 3 adenylate cyclase
MRTMEQKDYRLAAIMYTNIAGFSRMMEVDESGTLELLAYHNELAKGIVESRHGTIVKTIGDALLVDFKNTVEALQSAMAIQDALYARNRENPGLPLLMRIGLHLGDIYFFENDALGEGINIAARLQSLARPGCICFSQDIYNIVLNKIEFKAEKLGKVTLKNIAKEIHAYEIATPNVEFDPNRDKPRPGLTPGSYQDESDRGAIPVGGRASASEAQGSAARAPEASPERSYSEQGSRNLLSEIRRAILQDTKAMGRRMTVDEARSRYSFFGVEADEVIAAMAEQGLLVRNRRGPEPAGGSGLPPFIAGFGRNERGEFDANALKSNIEAAVHGIVNEIEKSVERNMSGEVKQRYTEKFERYEDKYRRHAERYRARAELRAESRGESLPEDSARDFDSYKRRLEARHRGARGGFIGNFTSFLAVNGFLWFLNLSTSASFLWAAIVSAGWGIGVVASAVAAKRSGDKLREVDAMPELDREQLADYKKLNRMKDAIAQHGATTVMVPFLLGLINFMTGPGFLWFLIPTAAMLVGFLSHFASYAAGKPRLERRLLDSLGVKGGWRNIFRSGKARRAEVTGLGPYADLYREAEAAKEAIAALLASGQAGPVEADLAPSLDQYLSQVRLLAQSAHEIDRLVEGIPMVDLAKDREALVAKESAASESLKAEYRKSIEEIDKQENSYRELKEQSEVVRLRLGSSVNQLKQMRLDIARLQASPSSEGAATIEGLKRRTDELSHYLEDLRSGYAESRYSDADPFALLEREEKRRLAEEARQKGALEEPKQ